MDAVATIFSVLTGAAVFFVVAQTAEGLTVFHEFSCMTCTSSSSLLVIIIYSFSFLMLNVSLMTAPCGFRELWFFVRIGPIRFLAGCRKRRLNQG